MKIKRQIRHGVLFFVAASLIWGGFSLSAEAKDKPLKLTYAFFAPAGTRLITTSTPMWKCFLTP